MSGKSKKKKVELLKEIAAGKKSVSELGPIKVVIMREEGIEDGKVVASEIDRIIYVERKYE